VNIVELIGFFIVLAAYFFILMKQAAKSKYRNEHPEEYQKELEEKERQLKEWLGVEPEEEELLEEEIVEEEELLEEEIVEEEEVVVPEPHLVIEKRREMLHDDVFKTEVVKDSRAKNILKKGTLKQAILIHSIIGKPKG